jgi:hypothetical protein
LLSCGRDVEVDGSDGCDGDCAVVVAAGDGFAPLRGEDGMVWPTVQSDRLLNMCG